jgi:hypothetical protein
MDHKTADEQEENHNYKKYLFHIVLMIKLINVSYALSKNSNNKA